MATRVNVRRFYFLAQCVLLGIIAWALFASWNTTRNKTNYRPLYASAAARQARAKILKDHARTETALYNTNAKRKIVKKYNAKPGITAQNTPNLFERNTRIGNVVEHPELEIDATRDTKTETIVENTKTETSAENTKVETAEDNTKVETAADNTKVETTEGNTKVETAADNAKIETAEDNTKVETVSGNTNVETAEDNTKVETAADNAKIETAEDNTKVETVSGNTNVETALEDNTKVETAVDNTKVETTEANTKVETAADNTKVETAADNTKVETVGGNTKIETAADNAKIEIAEDNTKSETAEDNTKVETVSGNTNVETDVDTTKAETAEDNAKIETAEDITKVETVSGNTNVETAEDNTKVETAVDNTKVETAVDNTKVETAEANTKVETAGGNTKIETAADNAKIEIAQDNTKAETAEDNTKVETVSGNTNVETAEDNTKVETDVDTTKVGTAEDKTKVETAAGSMVQTRLSTDPQQVWMTSENFHKSLTTNAYSREKLLSLAAEYVNINKDFTWKPNDIKYLNNTASPCWKDAESKLGVVCLPKFYLAGFSKCGTTDLWLKMKLHKKMNCAKCNLKEPHWWTIARLYMPRAQLEVLLQHYKIAEQKMPMRVFVDSMTQDTTKAIIDASSGTLSDHPLMANFRLAKKSWSRAPSPGLVLALQNHQLGAIHLLYQYTPQAKFIVVLRDPIQRLYSDYLFVHWKVLHDRTPSQADFHEQVLNVISFFKQCLDQGNDVHYCSNAIVPKANLCSIYKGLYVIGLYDLLKVIKRENLHVVHFDDYAKNRVKVMEGIFEFLGVGPDPEALEIISKETSRENSREGHGNGIGEMWPETEKLLKDFHKPFNQELARLLGDKRWLFV